MNKYLVEVAVTSAGIQIFSVEANSPEEAIVFVQSGDGEYVDEDMDTIVFKVLNAELND